MSDEQILEKIGMQNAPEQSKKSMLDSIKETIELRLMNTIGAILTEEQVIELESMQKEGKSREEMFSWLGEQLTDMQEMYDSALTSYLEDFVKRQERLGI